MKSKEHDKLVDFWDNCDPVFSHIKIEDYLVDLDSLVKSWENNFLKFYDFKNKVVIDYGIGGGYLGLYLLKRKELSKYVGFDISNRQLNEARKVLSNLPVILYNTAQKNTFNEFNADIFICQAVIQHFPSEEYLINFLHNINKSKINDVMLQIRYNEKTIFNENYNTTENVRLACQTNSDYILNYLTNYHLVKSKKIKNKSNYEYLFFQKI
jgi:ubiquinone/menaquinone biosynthesis C-methylase UbiE